MRRRSAFTLVELLIVVAILALLIGMLLPTLAKAKDLAKDTVCKNNLKNIWMPLRFYAEDYNGYLPSISVGDDGQHYFETWNQMLTQYGRNKYDWMPPRTYTAPEIFECPAYQFPYSRRGTYGLNGRMSEDIHGEGLWCKDKHYRLEETLRPAKMYLSADTVKVPPYGHCYNLGIGSWWNTTDTRHLEHANMMFHDSHIEDLTTHEMEPEAFYYLPFFNREEYPN